MNDRTETAPENGRMLSNGSVLAGRYRIEALTGVGGMGMVYRARDEELDVTVALKVMRPERLAEKDMLERFRRELVLARQVSHRNVVRIHDIGSDDGRLFLTMDYIDGRPLDDILGKEGPLPVDRTARIGAQLARALAAAHAEGIVHRDLKPANILITADDRAFITDFGIARSLADSGLTEAGSVLGTPDYLSPEQARGEEVDGRSDIYALGLILYRMLADELPFSGSTYEEIIAQHTAGHVRDIARTGVNVPAWLKRVLGRCLERNPGDRYQDAGDIARDLERHASTWYLRNRRGLAAVIVMVAVTTAAAIAWHGNMLPFSRPMEATGTIEEAQQEQHAIAVMPLRRDGNGEEWMTNGFPELLAAQLMESPELQVVAPGRLQRTLLDLDIAPERLAERDARQLMELLDIDRLVTGTVIGDAGTYRIQLQVYSINRPGSPQHRLSADIAAEQSWITALDILNRDLRTALEVDEAPRGKGRLTASLEALEAYTQGIEALRAGDSLSAVPQLEHAVNEDAGFVAAWVALSNAYSALGRDAEARDAADTAVSGLQPDSGRWAYEARAQQANLAGDAAQAERYMRELVNAYPHDTETRVLLAETIGESGRFDEAIAELHDVVAQDSNHPRAYYLLGKYSILKGDSQQAADEYLVRALVIQNRLGNDQGRADVLNAMGIAWHQLGNLEQAMEYYRQAADLREKIGDQRGVAAALSNIARIQLVEGDYTGARQQLEDALAALEAIGDKAGTANIHNELGILEEETGNYAAALERYRQALQIRQGMGDRRAMAESFNNVGYTYYLLGEYDNAAVFLRQSLDAYEQTENPDGMMQANQALGLLDIARGNWNGALKEFLKALDIARSIDFPHAMAVSHGNLGRIAQLQGRYESAAEAYQQAIDIMEAAGDPRGLAEFSLFSADMALELGMLDAAREYLDRVSTALETANNLEQAAWLAALQSDYAILAETSAAANRHIDSALEKAMASGSELTQLRVGASHVALLENTGKTEEALSHAKRYRQQVDALGNVPLQLELRRLESRIALARNDRERAANRAGEALRIARDAGDYSGAWQLHMLASQSAGTPASREDEREKALQEYRRIHDNMTDAQRAVFEQSHPFGDPTDKTFDEHQVTGT